MLRRGLNRIMVGLALLGLGLGAPIFAATPKASSQTQTKAHHHTQARSKKSHKPHHITKQSKNSKSTKTQIAHKSHHPRVNSHSHSQVATRATNPQDYALRNKQNFENDFAVDNNFNNQDFVNGGFDQEIDSRLNSDRSLVSANAEAQVGKPYQWGVENPDSGFDCSGLSQFVYAKEGIEIPRTAAEQYQNLPPVKNLQQGDLVFFRTLAHSSMVSHVGIYIGDGYFVHSPRTGETIRISRLSDSYWRDHYAGARRVLTKATVEKTIALEADNSTEDDS